MSKLEACFGGYVFKPHFGKGSVALCKRRSPRLPSRRRHTLAQHPEGPRGEARGCLRGAAIPWPSTRRGHASKNNTPSRIPRFCLSDIRYSPLLKNIELLCGRSYVYHNARVYTPPGARPYAGCAVVPPSTVGDGTVTPYLLGFEDQFRGDQACRRPVPGEMKSLRCANRHCPPAGKAAGGSIVRQRLYRAKWGSRRRHRWQACAKTFGTNSQHHAGNRRYEHFKSRQTNDSTHHRLQHGFEA